MPYFQDSYQGVGAIAAAAPAPRSAPAPMFGVRDNPELRFARRAVAVGAPVRALPGVRIQRQTQTRPPFLLSGIRRGNPPTNRYGAVGDDVGRPRPPIAGKVALRAAGAGLKASSIGQGRVMTAPPPRKSVSSLGPRTLIGQPKGDVALTPPSVFGTAVAPPVQTVGTYGGGVGPTLDYNEGYNDGESSGGGGGEAAAPAVDASAAKGGGLKNLGILALLAAGAYALTRKNKRSRR